MQKSGLMLQLWQCSAGKQKWRMDEKTYIVGVPDVRRKRWREG